MSGKGKNFPSEVLNRLVDLVRDAVPETVEIILFGSAARRELTHGSDLDILVVVPPHVSEKEATRSIYRSLRGFPYPVDVVVINTDRLHRFANRIGTVIRPALREGKKLYVASA